MVKKFSHAFKALAAVAMAALIGGATTSCVEDIDTSNKYTFKGETIADYIKNRPEEFSNFEFILRKAKIGKSTSGSILNTLTTYGSYTCFVPNNEAVEKYIEEQYYLWRNSKDSLDAGLIGMKDYHDTGIYSPYLEELSDSMATEIAKNHIIEKGFMTTDITEGTFPKTSFNNRFITLRWEPDSMNNTLTIINGNTLLIEPDIETVNGYIQKIGSVLSPSNRAACDLLGENPNLSIFSDAIVETGLDEVLRIYQLDPDYDNTQKSPVAMSTAAISGYLAPYPENYLQKYTILVEPNSVLEAAGINDLDDLKEFANKWYGEKYYDEVDYDDPTSPNNPLYRFVAYHILDRQLQYNTGSGPGGFIMREYEGGGGFNSEINMPRRYDRYDYFETLLPYTSIKVTWPSESSELGQELVLNYAQDGGKKVSVKDGEYDMSKHINVIVERESNLQEKYGITEFDGNALNGSIHIIDRVLVYNEDEMKGNILNERMRWDSSSLFPELTNNNVRWCQRTEKTNEIYIPPTYCKRLQINNESTYAFYLTPHATGLGGWANYQGDEILIDGQYDFQYRLPYLPEGTYEIRFGFVFSDARGVTQFYLDGKITGIPVEMNQYRGGRPMTTEEMTEYKEMTEEERIEIDKSLRNRGWMRGPGSVIMEDGSGEKGSMRYSTVGFRKIVTTEYLGKGDHWLRFKDVTKDANRSYNQFSQDYLEIVPKSIISDPTKPEDAL